MTPKAFMKQTKLCSRVCFSLNKPDSPDRHCIVSKIMFPGYIVTKADIDSYWFQYKHKLGSATIRYIDAIVGKPIKVYTLVLKETSTGNYIIAPFPSRFHTILLEQP